MRRRRRWRRRRWRAVSDGVGRDHADHLHVNRKQSWPCSLARLSLQTSRTGSRQNPPAGVTARSASRAKTFQSSEILRSSSSRPRPPTAGGGRDVLTRGFRLRAISKAKPHSSLRGSVFIFMPAKSLAVTGLQRRSEPVGFLKILFCNDLLRP